MADPFIGEIRPWALTFAPYQWAFCNGQLIAISQNSALFAILGTTYGGDGKTTFGLPNLQGRAAMHYGAGPGLTPRDLGEVLGSPNVTLDLTGIPNHTHNLTAQNVDANSAVPTSNYLAKSNEEGARGRQPLNTYVPPSGMTPMSPTAVQITGGGQPHENMQPYLAINMCIALYGIFPSRG
jgi:microcystin-dependent protein